LTYPYSIKHGKIVNDNRVFFHIVKKKKGKKEGITNTNECKFWVPSADPHAAHVLSPSDDPHGSHVLSHSGFPPAFHSWPWLWEHMNASFPNKAQ